MRTAYPSDWLLPIRPNTETICEASALGRSYELRILLTNPPSLIKNGAMIRNGSYHPPTAQPMARSQRSKW